LEDKLDGESGLLSSALTPFSRQAPRCARSDCSCCGGGQRCLVGFGADCLYVERLRVKPRGSAWASPLLEKTICALQTAFERREVGREGLLEFS